MNIFSIIDESEDSEADLHQCGHCKEMFTSLSVYITHKIEKLCKLPSRPHNHVKENDIEAAEDMQGSESPGTSKRCKVQGNNELSTLYMLIDFVFYQISG